MIQRAKAMTSTKDTLRSDNQSGLWVEDDVLNRLDALRAVVTRELVGLGYEIQVKDNGWSARYFHALTMRGAQRKAKRAVKEKRTELERELANIRNPLVIR